MTIGIAIPAYKNAQRLAQCLESIKKQAPDLLADTVVVDDSGTGEVANALSPEYPPVIWRRHLENQGFGRSATEAVLASPADIVVLLNDDVQLLNDPAPALLRLFSDPALFAVTFQSLNTQGHFREGAKRLVWKFGFPKILHNPRDQVAGSNTLQESSYAVGGHCAFRREYFERIGGFDSLFDPFYWEDVDLCLRARTLGWKTIYSPDCVVQHNEIGAIRSTHRQDDIQRITFRNRLLFARRHCPARLKLLLKMSTTIQAMQARLRGDQAIICAIIDADERWNMYASSKQIER
jgi:GT2 family glycosyltransferase